MSSYQSNTKWRVSSRRAKSRQILQRNVFRRLASFPAPPAGRGRAWGWGLAFMTAPGPDGQGSLAPSFVTCLRFWDLTWPGCPAPDEARRTGAAARVGCGWGLGGRGGCKNKQTQGETQHAREQKN